MSSKPAENPRKAKKKPPRKADYKGATPEQVGAAVTRHWAGSGPKPKNKRWL